MDHVKVYEKTVSTLKKALNVGKNLDAKHAEIIIGNKRCSFFYLEGFLNKQALERVFLSAVHVTEESWKNCESPEEFIQANLCFAECVPVSEKDAIQRVLAGFLVLLFEPYGNQPLAAEVRTMPQRSIQEPSKGKTLRGPHEGFTENIVTNLALIRRRVKTERFIAREFVFGTLTQTRVALCYIRGVADEHNVKILEEKLSKIKLRSFCMGEETLTERLYYRKNLSLLNPLPRTRFTERPDTCAAELCEGKIILLIDTTPNAIIYPMTLFDFFEECDNYYFPPLTATYLRIIRFFSILASLFLVPLWLFLVNQSAILPDTLSFLLINDPYAVPLFMQLVLIEIAIDALKLASLNTPEPLANSLSVVGGLLLGDFAVKSGWFVPQAILYSAIVTILNFIPNNYELGYSLKFGRILLIILVQLFGGPGLLAGTVFILLFLSQMRDAAGKGYLYPLLPFDKKAFFKLFFRTLHGNESQ